MSLAFEGLRLRKGDDPMIYLDDVFRYAMARLGIREDAEDVAIEVVQALPSPCNKRELRVYMLGMARRKIADHHRKRKTVANVRENDGSIRLDDKLNEASAVAAAMEIIAPEHREVLTLKYVVGLTSAEIGKMLKIRSDAVDSRLQRARDAFAHAYSPNEEVNS